MGRTPLARLERFNTMGSPRGRVASRSASRAERRRAGARGVLCGISHGPAPRPAPGADLRERWKRFAVTPAGRAEWRLTTGLFHRPGSP